MKPGLIASRLLRGIVAGSILTAVEHDYESLRDTKLAILGVDSLAFFQVLERIENDFNIELDYEALDFDSISTLNGVVTYVLDSMPR